MDATLLEKALSLDDPLEPAALKTKEERADLIVAWFNGTIATRQFNYALGYTERFSKSRAYYRVMQWARELSKDGLLVMKRNK